MEEVVKGMTIKINGDATDLKNELREIRNLAKKASSAVSSCTSKAKHMQTTIDRENPDNDATLLSLRRFVVRVAEDEKATPDQLQAMSRIASVIVYN